MIHSWLAVASREKPNSQQSRPAERPRGVWGLPAVQVARPWLM